MTTFPVMRRCWMLECCSHLAGDGGSWANNGANTYPCLRDQCRMLKAI